MLKKLNIQSAVFKKRKLRIAWRLPVQRDCSNKQQMLREPLADNFIRNNRVAIKVLSGKGIKLKFPSNFLLLCPIVV